MYPSLHQMAVEYTSEGSDLLASPGHVRVVFDGPQKSVTGRRQ